MKLHHWEPAAETICRIARELNAIRAEHVFIGECALRAHGCRGLTDSVEICVQRSAMRPLCDRLCDAGFETTRRGFRLAESDTYVHCVLRMSGAKVRPGFDVGEIRYPSTREAHCVDSLAVPSLPKLIEICLAARRYRDWAYVVETIRARDLDRSFADELSPVARSAFYRCYDSKVEEDRYNPEIHHRHPDEPKE